MIIWIQNYVIVALSKALFCRNCTVLLLFSSDNFRCNFCQIPLYFFKTPVHRVQGIFTLHLKRKEIDPVYKANWTKKTLIITRYIKVKLAVEHDSPND